MLCAKFFMSVIIYFIPVMICFLTLYMGEENVTQKNGVR